MEKMNMKSRNVHTAKLNQSGRAMGDYYGTGIKAKVGKMREDSLGLNSVTPKKLMKPPRSLA